MNETLDLLDLLAPRWVADAACTPGDTAELDPIVGGRPTRAELAVRTEAARSLCAHCPVLADCAARGDELGAEGVWGGALRYHVAGDPEHPLSGQYVAVPLISTAPASPYNPKAIARRMAARRRAARAGQEKVSA